MGVRERKYRFPLPSERGVISDSDSEIAPESFFGGEWELLLELCEPRRFFRLNSETANECQRRRFRQEGALS